MIRSFVLPGLVLAVVVGLTAGFMALAPNQARPAAQATLTLPIEVMHYDVFGEHDGNDPLPIYGGDSPRYVVSRTVDVSGTPGDLWLWGHQIGFQYFHDNFDFQQGAGDLVGSISSTYDAPYDGRAKASIRINGGAWIDINTDNVTCAAVEEGQFCIGGTSRSTRFRVENTASMLNNGSNTIEFAFLGHDMLSSGYRILDMAVLPSGYSGTLSHRDVLPADLITSTKIEEDVNAWTAPSGADPVAGQAMWEARDVLIDWPGGPLITASCQNCHADDGRDLQYFAYSNESIKVRSMHHGLSAQDGEDIAAYIRSVDLGLPNGDTALPGRPWNPPYQPAPRGFGPNDEHPDVAPADYWSAGAGLEWVADTEDETLAYVFPGGGENHDAGPFVQPPTLNITADRLDWYGQMNLREIPLSIQLPDWNSWLPIIHPFDAWTEDFVKGNEGPNAQQVSSGWNALQAAKATGDIGELSDLWKLSEFLIRQGQGNFSEYNTQWNRKFSRQRRGAQQWLMMEVWDVLSRNGNEDGTGYTDREVRTWGPTPRTSFAVASHISGDTQELDGPPFNAAGHSLTHIWYHLQLIKNGGVHGQTGASPIDWNYQKMFHRAFAATGLSQHARWWTTVAKVQQKELVSGHQIPQDLTYQGFKLYDTYRMTESSTWGASDALTGELLSAYLDANASFMLSQNVNDFSRDTDPNDRDRDRWGMPEDQPYATNPTAGGAPAARNYYNVLRLWANNYPISADALDKTARFGRNMWSDPQSGSPPWETWIIGEGAGGVSVKVSGDNNPAPAPANFTLTVEIEGEDFDPTFVEIYIDDMLFAELEDAPFEVAWEGVVEGTYEVTAQAYAADGTSLISPPVTVEVTVPLDDPGDGDNPSGAVGPVGFASADVGPVGLAGSASFEDAQYTVSGSGSDIWNQQDEYHFAYQEVSGDGAIIARLTSQDNTDPWAKTGVMIRESLASDAAHAMVVGTPENGARLQYRAEAGSESSDAALDELANAPVWLRLEREGNLLTGMISYDGQSWESESSITMDLPETVVVGLAVTSHNNTVVSTATYEGVSLTWLESVAVEQVLTLDAGWNMVARHVEPTDADMEVLWEALGDALVLVKNAAGANYFPEFGINEIGAWVSDEAYMAFVTEPTELTITGEQLPLEQRSVELTEGWSYAPYRGTAPLEAEEAFAGLDGLLLAVDQEGGVYFPEQGLNTIGALLPGRGYRVFLTAAETWALPAAADEPEGASLIAGQQAQSKFSPSASILLLDAPSVPSGHRVDVLTADSMVVGTGTIAQGRAAIVVAAEEAFVAAGTGAQAGEPLMLRTGAEMLPVVQVQDVLSGEVSEALAFAANTVLHVHLGTGAQELALLQSYPNPARTGVTVPLEVPTEGRVRLLLYDALGRQVRTLLDEPLAPGRHEVHVDVSGLASGVYHYQLRAGDTRASGRMTVVR